MVEILKKLKILLDKKQKKQMLGLVVMMFIAAALETASIGLVLGVVTLIITPDVVSSNELIAKIYNFFGFQNETSFIVLVMALLILAFVLKNVYLFLEWKAQYAFTYKNQFRTSEKMLQSYLKKNYEYYLFADTAVVQRSITSDVNNMYALILALLTLTSEAIVFIALGATLMVIDPIMCIVIAVLLLSTMFVIKQVLKPIMQRSGKENQDFYSGLFKWISQTVQGIKEIKIGGREQYFVDSYNICGNGYVNAVQRYSLYNNTPKLLIETVCVAGMIGYMIVMIIMGEDLSNKMPIISAFGVAAIKLMPSANKINNQLNSISYLEPFFLQVSDTLIKDIEDGSEVKVFMKKDQKAMAVNERIELKGITYKYPKTDKLIFDHADMEIPIGSAVGVVGASGAGKTTIIDILLGLLDIEDGAVYADGVDTKEDYYGWLKNIGYIPQTIYMLDGSIRENVAFGVKPDEISEERVWEVLREAHLDDFIKSLPEQLDTQIGERGIRLSGGQRQRIGIARALYDNPEILVLDEATSALDGDTEAAIMESINALHGKKTLVIIAHRLQTIEKCDMIYRVSGGKIKRER